MSLLAKYFYLLLLTFLIFCKSHHLSDFILVIYLSNTSKVYSLLKWADIFNILCMFRFDQIKNQFQSRNVVLIFKMSFSSLLQYANFNGKIPGQCDKCGELQSLQYDFEFKENRFILYWCLFHTKNQQLLYHSLLCLSF